MKINFNNVRKQAMLNYISLVEKLNASLTNDYLDNNSHYTSRNVKIEAEYIEKDLENLRFNLFAICLTSEEGNDEFKDLSDEFPEDVVCFNGEDVDE